MKTAAEIETELRELRERMGPLRVQEAQLECDLRAARSREFIRANGITRADVEFCDGPGHTYHGIVLDFAEWLRKQPHRKPWVTWNGWLHRTNDLLAGEMSSRVARVDELEG